jgi:DNA-binding transcriptional regulator YbjK
MLATIENSPVKRRTKGEKTKNLILLSAIEVLAQQGIKGATHRAIATHANIQLSLTTYYFKDIQELVHQAFELNTMQTVNRGALSWNEMFQVIESYGKTSLRKVNVRAEVRDKLVDISTQYVVRNIIERSTEIIVEQQLFSEIQVTPKLRKLASLHREELLRPFIRLCSYFNKEHALIDADIALTMLNQLEYRHMLADRTALDVDNIRAVLYRVISIITRLKN